ncbi:MAG TPA: PIN domain-containing protein [Hyphomonas sp.]|nr:PIN domain-containing protein [Hyphomonas sp.]HRK67647.1 PIN domain-containing protein [Hyphomonas sp.]
MFANRYTALIDACVLVSAAKRDLILSLAHAEMFRFRWTDRIMAETETALTAIFSERLGSQKDAASRATHSCKAMCEAFPEAMIEGNFSDVPAYDGVPDKNDHHIIHAAVLGKASMIVTDNLKHFPEDALRPHDIEVRSADAFIADAIDLDRIRAAEAVKALRARLINPTVTAQDLLDRWEQHHGLVETVRLLRDYQGLI